MPDFSTPAVLSTATFTRYTSFERSSAVCTLRGVNSAFVGDVADRARNAGAAGVGEDRGRLSDASRGTLGSST